MDNTKKIFLVLVALGSNLGEKEKNLRDGWRKFIELPGIEEVKLSNFYETEPVGGPASQEKYLNAAGLVQTELEPEELLEAVHKIEQLLGRERKEHWGPRTLDIDILLYGDKTIHIKNLTIPHPLMHERRFVLDPACEIASEMVHPLIGKRLSEIRNALFTE
ncbi:MAG: 2-amino-4-hydroxy-6-hydroxymethyldihydropteridine diphosphokinase [Thermoguttaceae bacterium]